MKAIYREESHFNTLTTATPIYMSDVQRFIKTATNQQLSELRDLYTKTLSSHHTRLAQLENERKAHIRDVDYLAETHFKIYTTKCHKITYVLERLGVVADDKEEFLKDIHKLNDSRLKHEMSYANQWAMLQKRLALDSLHIQFCNAEMQRRVARETQKPETTTANPCTSSPNSSTT